MSQAAKMQEPSMEEILASIRRIISDEETPPKPSPPKPESAPAAARPAIVPPAAASAPAPAKAAPPPAAAPRAADIGREFDAIFDEAVATVNAETESAEPDILELTEDMKAAEPGDDFAPASEPPVFRSIDGQSDVFFADEEVGEVAAEPAAKDAPEPVFRPARPAAAPMPAFAPAPPPVNGAAYGSPLLSAAASASVDSAFHSLAQAVMVQNGRTLEDIVCDMMRPMLKAWLDDNLPGLVERLVRAEIERVSRGRP